ncbi:hypothetical protein D3C83_48510 [compost metagenome]
MRPSAKKFIAAVTSSAVGVRRNARRAAVVTIRRAHAISCTVADGRQVKTRRRLAESSGRWAVNGPWMRMKPIAG